MTRQTPSRLPDWVNFIAAPILIALGSWGGWNAFDVRERIVRVETQMADVKAELADLKTMLGKIGADTAPHDPRTADR